MEKIYLSGNLANFTPDIFAQFNQVEKELRRNGKDVLNPANELFRHIEEKARIALAGVLLVSCTGVHFINGWQLSNQSRAERLIATALGLSISFEGIYSIDEIERVKTAVTLAFGLNIGDLTTKRRDQNNSFARMAATFIFTKYFHLKDSQIAKYLNRDRATIIYYQSKIKDECKYNKTFASKLSYAEDWVNKGFERAVD